MPTVPLRLPSLQKVANIGFGDFPVIAILDLDPNGGDSSLLLKTVLPLAIFVTVLVLTSLVLVSCYIVLRSRRRHFNLEREKTRFEVFRHATKVAKPLWQHAITVFLMALIS